MGGRGAVSATSAKKTIAAAAKKTVAKNVSKMGQKYIDIANKRSDASEITKLAIAGNTVYYEKGGKLYSATKSEFKKGVGSVAYSGIDFNTQAARYKAAGKSLEKLWS